MAFETDTSKSELDQADLNGLKDAAAAGQPLQAAQSVEGRDQDGEALDEEEEEPRLKYQRLGSSVTEILQQDAASCLCVSDKLLAMGTHDGTIHVLDYAGNEVSAVISSETQSRYTQGHFQAMLKSIF